MTTRDGSTYGGLVAVVALDHMLLLLVANVNHRAADETGEQIVGRNRLRQILRANGRHDDAFRSSAGGAISTWK